AHNLLTALIDNNIQNKRYSLGLDARTIRWKRVIDMNDRSLRDIIIGLGGTRKGIPRETGFDITAASEVMAALCMATDLVDLKERFGNFFIGMTMDDQPVFARDLKAQGAMAALMKYAVMPNLVQTLEATPAIIHGGPFANIAQGTNSIIATKMGMTLSDYVVTEAGFASELGAEKFFNLKCQNGKLSPKAAVIVATIRALKYHGGSKIAELKEENMGTLEKGFENLDKHIENIQYYGFEPVVAINRFNSDTDKELELLQTYLEEKGIMVSLTESWEKGGEGAVDLAEKVIDAMKKCPACFKPLYNFDQDIETKIHAIATKMYGADNVEYALQAKKDLDLIKQLGFEHLGICIAKTQKSISDDKYKKGRPRGFTVKIREIEIASGAGFVVPISGSIMRMPGLPSIPSAEQIDIDEAGNISGLF
ncbi:MAG: formate--tetrahydrofolate ligase, partial [Bacteroidales bacterium]|nr:formate--tetrahydrofolate ligase [Bacteroidales bacterium]